MPLSLFAVVPGFLFARGSTLGPLSTRSMPAARFPRAPVTKSNPGGAYGDFSGFSFLEVGPSTMVPSAGLVIPTPPEVFPTTSPETTRDSAPIWVDFVRCGLPEVSAVIFDIFEFWVGPIGSGWRDQNVLNGFVSFASPKAGGPPPRSSLGLPPGGVPFGVAADWLTAKRFNLFGNPWVKMEVESYAYPRDLSDQRRVFFIASALAVPVKLGVFSSLLVLDICEITLCETVKSVLLASRVAASNPKLTVLSLFYLYGLAGVMALHRARRPGMGSDNRQTGAGSDQGVGQISCAERSDAEVEAYVATT
jgi:hypothetical protein